MSPPQTNLIKNLWKWDLSLRIYTAEIDEVTFTLKIHMWPWSMWLSWLVSCPHKPKDHRFDSWSWHMSGLQVRYLVRACTLIHEATNRCFSTALMFLSHFDVSLPLFPSLKSVSMSLGKDKKN